MTLRSRILAFFPAMIAALAIACVVELARHPGPLSLVALAAVLYVLPVLAFRIHDLVCPIREGESRMDGKTYCPWFGGHQFQLIYIAIPQLEALLRIVPGLYSAWLRLWGSRVGRGVYWTPRVEILDRNLLDIGHGVVFGHMSGASGHLIMPTKNGGVRLQLARVRIGDGAFIGGASYLAPGAVLEAGAFLRMGNHVMPFETVRAPARAEQSQSPGARATAADSSPPAAAEA
ncbi:MAG TPA: hypothetical protein VM580_23075 [Labilithrix sp.]|nr:hypothetical protein [Labilithrix sp.]